MSRDNMVSIRIVFKERWVIHYLGSMLPYVDPATGERTTPKFAQIYIVDPDMQARAQRRKGIYADLDNVALKDIEDMMERCNPFAQQFLNSGKSCGRIWLMVSM
ncbi:hypothetical protein PR003_g34526 [Phytophthora rubi]|uniref:Helitron helicase-like domain-containing protein n=1 Tax=Phytophthora rubi TaxID=129364 RepID=A0A6A3G187_9STRA|nr:hypothetical protein PR002_g32761 [Phytophthora rubi]KAE9260064.1 hypothetical protein PR003_g34526 [Phytophthora rubi]